MRDLISLLLPFIIRIYIHIDMGILLYYTTNIHIKNPIDMDILGK